MLPKTRSPRMLLLAGAIVLGALSSACHDEPTAPAPDFAKGGGGGSSGPSVRSVDPDSAPQDTTLDVHVYGSGFDNGSKVKFGLNGDTTTPNVVTNSVRFVSSSELLANITVAANAVPDKYDVYVITSQGKPGMGTEMLTVTVEVLYLGDLGGDGCEALAINESAHVTGWACTATGEVHAFFWDSVGGMKDLGVLPGTNYSVGNGINSSDQVAGYSRCKDYAAGAWCLPRYAVVWQRSGDGWTVRALSPSGNSQASDINDAGDVGGYDVSNPVIWMASGAVDTLPVLEGYTGGMVYRLNNTGQAIGTIGWYQQPESTKTVLWSRDAATGRWNISTLLSFSNSCGTKDLTDRDLSGVIYAVSCKSRLVLAESGPGVWAALSTDTLAVPEGGSTTGMTSAEAVNASGAVAGYGPCRRCGGWFRAERWFSGTTAGEMLPQPTGSSNYARGINNSGWIVGRANGRAVMWREKLQ